MKHLHFYCFIGFFLLVGLGTISAQNKTTINPQIQNLITKKRAFNKSVGFGFRVQIFYGEETNAKEILSKFTSTFPDVNTKLVYNQPYWKVQVGAYKTKLEADKARLIFSEKFSGLIVVSLGK